MRNELELIKKIEGYLNGQLSAQEMADFESEIAANPTLREDVELQRQIMQGIGRAVIKQSIQQARLKFKWYRWFFRGGLGGLIIATVISSVPYYANHKRAYRDGQLPEYNESGLKDWSSADSNLAAQTFMINAAKDTVIETAGGMVLAIPANAFLNGKGEVVSGEIEFVVKEALDEASIMKAGLSTMSGNQLLESGGMFFIDARKNGDPLTIDPKNSIYGQVPTDSVKANMQLFQGKRMANGAINWIKPKPLDHDLIPIDIQSLNFYPPKYLSSLAKWGYDNHNKKFTDSMYYSLAWQIEQIEKASKPTSSPALAEFDKKILFGSDDSSGVDRASITSKTEATSLLSKVDESRPITDDICAINPAKIKAIWNKKFQNTIIATLEFEKRLSAIHNDGDEEILNLYMDNLDKPIFYIDSLIATMDVGCRGVFAKFAALHTGGIKTSTAQIRNLQDYYRIKSKAYAKAAEKTPSAIWKKQAALDQIAYQKQNEHDANEAARNAKNFEEEFDVNLKDAYRQLGYQPTSFRPLAKSTYNVQITNTGWSNVDKYVYESVQNRTTLDFTDAQTGKKAIIKYLPVSFKIDQYQTYERLYVYLLPDKLSSFMRVNGTNGLYKEKLDELMKYDMVCVAYKNDQAFVYSQTSIEPKEYASINLLPVTEKQLQLLLNKSKASGMKEEVAYQRFDIQDQKRRKANAATDDLANKVRTLISHCIARDTVKKDTMVVYKKM